MIKGALRYFHQFTLLALALSGLLILSACSIEKNKETDTTSYKIEQIQRKIQNQSYQEAEADLDSLLKKEPDNLEVRMTYASLFVHKAGIKVKDYFKLEEAFAKEDKKESSEPQQRTSFLPIFDQVLLVSKQSQELQKRLDKITLINKTQAEEIAKAIAILNQLTGPKVTAGMHLYRAVIKTYYFKYEWSLDLYLPQNTTQLCKRKISQLSQNIESLNQQLSDILVDYSKGLPNSRDNIQKTKSELNRNSYDIQMILLSSSKDEQLFSDFIKEKFDIEVPECQL
jgi:hypothetical protein